MSIGKAVIPVRAASAPAPSCATACPSASGCSSAGASCGGDPASQSEQQGWIPRTTIGEPRLSEIAENYRAMGYEVRVERWDAGTASSCSTCYDGADKSGAAEVWGTVYVRPGKPDARHDDMF